MPCAVPDDVMGTRESRLTRHGDPVVVRTFAEAEATAEELRHERAHTRDAAAYRYWVLACPSGENAGGDAHAQVPSHRGEW